MERATMINYNDIKNTSKQHSIPFLRQTKIHGRGAGQALPCKSFAGHGARSYESKNRSCLLHAPPSCWLVLHLCKLIQSSRERERERGEKKGEAQEVVNYLQFE